jgi:hypothetical protein
MNRLEPQARDKSTEAVMGDARPNWLPWLIIRLLIQTIRQDRLDPSGPTTRPM